MMKVLNSGCVVLAVVGFLGCKTPNKYVPTEAGTGVEPEGGASLTPDSAAEKLDAAPSMDSPAADSGTAPPMDAVAPASDLALSPDMGPPPCTDGTARCAPSGTAVEMCTNGQWTTKETCPLTCAAAACTAVCMANAPCTQGIGPCRKGATSCASAGSEPVCKDSGADDSKGGCTGGKICSGGQCVANPCAAPSAGNLVPNAGFDSSIWPKFENSSYGIGNWTTSDAGGCPTSGSLQVGSGDDARICVTYGSAATIYAGYMVNRSTPEGDIGCYVDTWYLSPNCQDAWDYGNVDDLTAPNATGWRQVSAAISTPPMTKSLVLACHLVSLTAAPALLDRVYVRTSPGGF
jgi:hypothetical protein